MHQSQLTEHNTFHWITYNGHSISLQHLHEVLAREPDDQRAGVLYCQAVAVEEYAVWWYSLQHSLIDRRGD